MTLRSLLLAVTLILGGCGKAVEMDGKPVSIVDNRGNTLHYKGMQIIKRYVYETDDGIRFSFDQPLTKGSLIVAEGADSNNGNTTKVQWVRANFHGGAN